MPSSQVAQFPLHGTELQTATLTAYGEARGEISLGIAGVLWVIRRRAEKPRWWGRTVNEVCLKLSQFSCWLLADPNREALEEMTKVQATDVYKRILALACGVFGGTVPDPTNGADHYCVTTDAPKIKWARYEKPLQIIGHHSFYKLEK